MSCNILIVDDDATIRQMVRAFIERDTEWIICGEAENGALAVEQVQRSHPDIVILDLQMPVMNGLEAARHITRIAPKTIVVMFTFQVPEELQRAADAAGIQRVFSKSQTVASLVAWLKSRRGESALRPA